jgi:hypothetical protein
VVETGVAHVMRLFMAHATGNAADGPKPSAPVANDDDHHLEIANKIVEVECDEVALDKR